MKRIIVLLILLALSGLTLPLDLANDKWQADNWQAYLERKAEYRASIIPTSDEAYARIISKFIGEPSLYQEDPRFRTTKFYVFMHGDINFQGKPVMIETRSAVFGRIAIHVKRGDNMVLVWHNPNISITGLPKSFPAVKLDTDGNIFY